MSSNVDQLPRVFQANLARLFDRVILPGLEELAIHPQLEHGEAATLDAFLDRAAAQVDNYTANEAAKAYVLTLAAVFERQMSVWARACQNEGRGGFSRTRGFEALLTGCADQAGIELERDQLGSDLSQMFLVANVVRHGDGRSCEKLQAAAPELWEASGSDFLDPAGRGGGQRTSQNAEAGPGSLHPRDHTLLGPRRPVADGRNQSTLSRGMRHVGRG